MTDPLVAPLDELHQPPAEVLSERRQRRRDELVESIATLIRTDGPDVSMDQIAAACGVTKPIIYRHFGDRDGIVRALTARYVGAMGELATNARVDPEPISAISVLRRQIDTYLHLIEQDTELFQFLVANQPAGPDRHHLLAAVTERVTVLVRGYLEGAGRSTVAAPTMAHALVGMVHHVGLWWLTDRTVPRDRLVDQLVTIAWNGLGSEDLSEPTPSPVTDP
jgi:AcrR family transcriptional regulator